MVPPITRNAKYRSGRRINLDDSEPLLRAKRLVDEGGRAPLK
jgi:hypothetical protein